MRRIYFILLLSFPLFAETQQPEFSSGHYPKEAAFGKKMMVVSANPLASKAGMEILEKGGNAIDAAIAMQMVLNVVEPQSSGIGGGALLLYYEKEKKRVYAFDGRETAPINTQEDYFLDENKEPIPIAEAIVGGRSVGVPGLLKMLEAVHQEFGKLPWRELFLPAIQLAEEGFPISNRLHQLISKTPNLATFSTTKEYLFKRGKAKPEGEILKNPELATTFKSLAKNGTFPFYQGAIAREIVHTVQNAPLSAGTLTLEDLANYQPKRREPIRTKYRDFIVYGFPPPSAGGIVTAQLLGMLEHHDLSRYPFGSAAFINLFSQASRLAYADRDYYIADPDYFPVPVYRLTHPEYLEERAGEIQTDMVVPEISRGAFPGQGLACCLPLHASTILEFPSTSQICVVDAQGNALSMTTSIENAFGSTLMVGGFFLNNHLTDFSLVPEKEGKKAANRIEPGKRPLSSMSPTLVFKKGEDDVLLSLGSAGGSRIIDYVAKVLFGVLDYQLNVQEAIDFPNFASISKTIDLEKGTFLEKDVPELEKWGNEVRLMALPSGTQAIQRTQSGLIGGSDPRREGLAIGN